MSLRLRSSIYRITPTVRPSRPASQKYPVSKRAGSPRTLCLRKKLYSEEEGKYSESLRQDGTLWSKHFFDGHFLLADDDLYRSSTTPSNLCHWDAALIDDTGPPSHRGLTLAFSVGILASVDEI